MHTLLSDLRYGVRRLFKSPGFAIIAILALALGIGANSAIFSLVDRVLIRPLPYAHPDRLVMVWEDASFISFPRNTPAVANFVDWKKQNQVFSDMAAARDLAISLTGDGVPEMVLGGQVTANLLDVLGVKPMLGRAFTDEAIGAAAALGVTRSMTKLLVGVQPADPAIYAGVVLLLMAVAFTACSVPAARASRVDPMLALREE